LRPRARIIQSRAVDTLIRPAPAGDSARVAPTPAAGPDGDGAAPDRAAKRSRLDTPRALLLIGIGLIALSVALVLVMVSGASSARGGLSAMQARTNEVAATNDLYFRLGDMDAQAADALLVGFHPTITVPASVDAAASMANYQADRSAADSDLQRIAANPALATPYRELLDDLGGYEALIAQAFYIDQNTLDEAPASPPAAALALYETATGQMHDALLPTAAQITSSDVGDVDGAYGGDLDSTTGYSWAVGLLALAMLAALVLANRFLDRRFRRILAPALVAAFVLAAAVGGGALAMLRGESGHFTTAKTDAFDSINALTTARAVSDDANADESRWLLDRTPAFQLGFFADAVKVLDPGGVTAQAAAADPATYYDAVKNGTSPAALGFNAASNSVSPSGPDDVGGHGYLGDELDNITFPGEARAAYNTVLAYNAYIQDDATIRGDAADGNLAAAVTFDIGLQQGQSNHDFGVYDQDLLAVVGINQSAFQSAVSQGTSELGIWDWLPFALVVALPILVAAAIHPRLREYS
jgi:hypothetical protein